MGITNAFALLRLVPGNDHDKEVEILALRHQLAVLHRQLGGQRVRFEPADRAWLAALLSTLPRPSLHRLRLLVRPDTVLRWHRDLHARRHAAASRPRRPGRPRTIRSIRAQVLRLVRQNPSWGYRRVHGELLSLGVKVAASTVWEILREAGIDPAPDRTATTWAQFLRSQAEALLAADFLETITLTGTRMYILAVIEHASRRIRILGATAHPTADWVAQTARNLVMDLEDAGCSLKYLIRDRDGKVPGPVRHHPRRRRDHGRAQRRPDAPDERGDGTLGTDLPARTTRPYFDLQPATPAARTTPVRDLLQRAPTASRHRQRPTAGPTTRTDHRPGQARPPEHPPT